MNLVDGHLPATSSIIDRRDEAAPARTLVDILRATAARHPDSAAIEDPAGTLTYAELLAAVEQRAAALVAAGVRRGDRVGVRLPSGTRELYAGILSVLAAGAAYVPVDADDPAERAELVFGEADVAGVLAVEGYVARTVRAGAPPPAPGGPTPDDDAWIIFTSGSTGLPKGVAVSHRSAAAFVDAEADLFLAGAPLGPSDRVLAGLSVAFDASCEEMWLAWRNGACLVPAPRATVRSGADLGGWLVRHRITVVSTVPTLAGLWPVEALEQVRLLIFGGEACPPELAARLVADGREVWNTYGPTEATVVATASLLDGISPVLIGLPLAGWSIAVVGPDGTPVAPGTVGELVIGGVGLARYLDPAKDAEKYAPLPSLGWDRAYRSGDLVALEPDGLSFHGRADDQVKVGGRRIELGEVEAALTGLPGVDAAAVAVRRTEAGVAVLVGYVVTSDGFDRRTARASLAERMPAALIPLLAPVDHLPTRTSGKVDRDALPWPLPALTEEITESLTLFSGDEGWLAREWVAVLGTPVLDRQSDFFELGGGSLTAAQLVSRIRQRAPEFSVADVYDHPRLAAMAAAISDTAVDTPWRESFSRAGVTPLVTRWAQTVLSVPLFIISGARWLTYLLAASWILRAADPRGFAFLPAVGGWVVLVGLLLFAVPFGRMAISAAVARLLLAGVRPGDYRRGGRTHLRLWLAEQVAHQVDPVGLAGAPWVTWYARALGARIGRDVDLHTLPPVTGMLRVDDGAAIEPEVDLAGYWIDGDTVRIGAIRIGARASVGARSTLAPGTRIEPDAEVAPGSAVFGRVHTGQLWAGSPAARSGEPSDDWPTERPPARRRWLAAYALSSTTLGLLPVLAYSLGGLVVALGARGSVGVAAAATRALPWLPLGVVVAGTVMMAAIVVLVRLLSIGLAPGTYPVRSRVGWQAWTTERLLDQARTQLFPLYASLATPVWLRLLGARIGRNVEASTVVLIPSLTTVEDGAFLADDTMVASYDLRNGWLRLGRVTIGQRAFLGNSGTAGAGHVVPRDGLVAVLSVAPVKAKPGSSWLGSPPVRLRRTVVGGDLERTYRPSRGLQWARGAWEACRLLAVVATCVIGLVVLLTLARLAETVGVGWTLMLSGPVMVLAGVVAAALTTAAKWVVVGPIRAGEQPLWSSFVWRTEVADTFTEMVAGPWFANPNTGTPALAVWLRSLGARVGRGVWCETYWLPEPDLVTLGDGATVNRGCVVQTHLFHDRIMSMDAVEIERGGTLGPHSIVLPGATIGAHATIGPASLVMRGESVPTGSRWSGNPIGPWRAVKVRTYQADAR
ncbi:MAG: amino acid adenylation domain-containing protein [Propionicimonas sp.]|uniref:Pls/PosA family non-ribosomal peptide synthetase n=1 Tax=Propionicimonas sp. TaxID=1955623 RepID=UPI003D0DDF0D